MSIYARSGHLGRVAVDFDSVAQVAIAPHRSASLRARCCIGRPMLEFREVRPAGKRCQFDGQVGGAADGLAARCEPQQSAGPADATREFEVVFEIRMRCRSVRPWLRQAISQRGAEHNVAARNTQCTAHVQRGVGPRSQRLVDAVRRGSRLDAPVHRE